MYPGEKTGTQEENELWNQIHVTLVRDLETKGILWRYGIKHLKLWTDLILDGKCSGAGEEPTWEEYLEPVIVPPKSRRTIVPVLPRPPPPLTTQVRKKFLRKALWR